MAKIFDAKRSHAPDDSYHTPPIPVEGIPAVARQTIADDWESTLPELVADLPVLESVLERLDRYLVETLASEFDE